MSQRRDRHRYDRSPTPRRRRRDRPPRTGQPLLQVRDLRTYFPIRKGVLSRTVGYVKAVDGVSFDVAAGQDARAWSANPAAARRRSAGRSCA